MRHRLSRIEHAILALQRGDADHQESETATQDQLDELIARLERLEDRVAED